MKFIKNKKGFSLVELVVGTAILSVVGLTVLMLMTAGTNMYRNTQKRSTILFKSQVSSLQLQETIMDCPYPIGISDDGCLMLGDIDDSGNRKIHVYYVDDNVMYLRNDTVNKETHQFTKSETKVPFCYNVTSVDFDKQLDPSEAKIIALKYTMNITRFGYNYGRNEVLSLRNRPAFVSGATEAETEQKLADKLGA